MSSATKAFALAGLAGSAAAFSGLAPAGLKPANGRLSHQRLQLRNARPTKVHSSPPQLAARPRSVRGARPDRAGAAPAHACCKCSQHWLITYAACERALPRDLVHDACGLVARAVVALRPAKHAMPRKPARACATCVSLSFCVRKATAVVVACLVCVLLKKTLRCKVPTYLASQGAYQCTESLHVKLVSGGCIFVAVVCS